MKNPFRMTEVSKIITEKSNVFLFTNNESSKKEILKNSFYNSIKKNKMMWNELIKEM